MKTNLVLSTVVIGATLLLPVAFAQEPSDAIRKEVLDAWAKRRLSTQTMQLEAAIERFVPGVKNQHTASLDPFDNFSPTMDQKSEWDLSYRCAGMKSWLRLHTEQNPLSGQPRVLHPYTMTAGFDGSEYRELLISKPSPFPYGKVVKDEKPGTQLTVCSMLMPVLLWKETEQVLSTLSWMPGQIVGIEDKEKSEQQGIVQVTVPRERGNWTSTLSMDADRGWLPLRWEGRHQGSLKFSYTLDYDMSDAEHPVLAGWSQSVYDDRGKLERREKATVASTRLDVAMKKDEFHVLFPTGTHVLEAVPGGHLYLVQGVDGLESLDPELFQKLPDERSP